jgi:hypothetical protein
VSTQTKGYSEAIRSTGRVTRIDGMDLDTRMKIDGTVSGRIQCEHPNFSEVPRDDQGRS